MTNATIRDVAHAAGVSVGTVSNFLNDTKPIAPDTRQRIEETIARLGFVPNNASRVMRGHRSLAIGLIVPDSPDPFFTDLARGVEDKARESGYVVVACNTDGIDAREISYVRALTEMRVAGAIVMPTSLATVAPHLQRLRQSGGRFVLLGEASSDIDACTIAFDDFAGGRAAADHLLALGHREILFVGGPGGERQISERLAGARAALEAAGLDPGRCNGSTPPAPASCNGPRSATASSIFHSAPRRCSARTTPSHSPCKAPSCAAGSSCPTTSPSSGTTTSTRRSCPPFR
ncbi:LacI family transcriptional regulator [Microbacterium sp. Se63.02b]|nr:MULTISPECIES: LacI family DNA-binding transcriptional regulator [unclassified Microbacterium]QNA93534.1 LacI family transcriptional regulator [Microbacterium sp. Se63.02b]QYM63784.1 LacI family transcriptional regulator [Microbacterium sp. Se5.02b]